MSQTLSLREHIAVAAAYIVLATAMPRLAYLLRWPYELAAQFGYGPRV